MDSTEINKLANRFFQKTPLGLYNNKLDGFTALQTNIYKELLRACDGRFKSVYYSQDTIAKAVGSCRMTVVRALKALKQGGYIDWESAPKIKIKDAQGVDRIKQGSNRYWLTEKILFALPHDPLTGKLRDIKGEEKLEPILSENGLKHAVNYQTAVTAMQPTTLQEVELHLSTIEKLIASDKFKSETNLSDKKEIETLLSTFFTNVTNCGGISRLLDTKVSNTLDYANATSKTRSLRYDVGIGDTVYEKNPPRREGIENTKVSEADSTVGTVSTTEKTGEPSAIDAEQEKHKILQPVESGHNTEQKPTQPVKPDINAKQSFQAEAEARGKKFDGSGVEHGISRIVSAGLRHAAVLNKPRSSVQAAVHPRLRDQAIVIFRAYDETRKHMNGKDDIFYTHWYGQIAGLIEITGSAENATRYVDYVTKNWSQLIQGSTGPSDAAILSRFPNPDFNKMTATWRVKTWWNRCLGIQSAKTLRKKTKENILVAKLQKENSMLKQGGVVVQNRAAVVIPNVITGNRSDCLKNLIRNEVVLK